MFFYFFVAFIWAGSYKYFVRILRSRPSHKERRIAVAEKYLSHPEAGSEKRSYSVSEAAEILGVSKRSVYNLCAQGTFKTVRIGTRLRISKKSFDDWLDGSNQT